MFAIGVRRSHKQLLPTDAKFLFASRLVQSSVARHRVQLGSDRYAPSPHLRVLRVEQIVNPRLLNRYLGGLEDLEGLHQGVGCTPIQALGSLKIHQSSLELGALDLNEHFAFHGAQNDIIDQICAGGFDPQRGGEGAGRMFGVATYFATTSSKSDIYTDDLARNARLPRSA